MTNKTHNIGNMIFHVPFTLNHQATSASGIRPIQMIKAFTDIGYSVDVVEGTSSKRRLLSQQIKAKIKKGKQYNFLYSESSTMPTLLTDSHHLPLAPRLDFSFFSFLKQHHIPIGLFYRDIYWLFDEYKSSLPFWKFLFANFFYRYDLYQYKKLLSKLYLPSTQMARYLPTISSQLLGALPPGHQNQISTVRRISSDKIRLLYIGGLGSHYQMHKLFKALRACPDVTLTLCTRESEWKAVQNEYCPQGVPDNISIVHKSGSALTALYNECDLAVIFVRPFEYREFAAPVKLYEYIGYGKPLIASEGTLVGEFVKENAIGWTVPYSCSSLQALLHKLESNKSLLTSKIEALKHISPEHSWKKRAEKVAADLGRKAI
jgi:glycosyltransferase involved in cell wall biosynthesis